MKNQRNRRTALHQTLISTMITACFSVAHAEEATELPTVHVTAETEKGYKTPDSTVAGKVPLAPREIPNSVSVLTRQQMDDQGLTSVHDALVQATGVTVISNDTSTSQYLSRGYNLGVMYDGVTSYNGMTPSHQMDLSLYERIEVLRGPAGLMRGVGEPGGVVNLVKKRPTKDPLTTWSASIGSFDNKRVEGDISRTLNEDKSLRGRLVISDEDRGYFYKHTHGRKWSVMGVLEYDLTPATTLLLSRTSQNSNVKAPWSGLPTSSAVDGNGHYQMLNVSPSTFNAPDWGKMLYRTDETSASAEHRFDNKWVAKASYNRRDWHRYYKYAYTSSSVDATTNLLSYSSSQADGDYAREGIDLFANGPFELLGRNHNLLFGFNSETYRSLERSGNGPAFNNVFFGDTSTINEPAIAYTTGSQSFTKQYGLYSQLRLSLADPLTLVIGGRSTTFQSRSRKVSPATSGLAWVDGAKANNEITPYSGLLYDLTKDVTLYGSISEIFVPQTQLKADGSTLDPRTGQQKEIGAKGDFMEGKLGASIAWFNIRDKNRAYADPADATGNTYLNAGEVESKGYELEISGKVSSGLSLIAGYTNLTTRYLSDRNKQGKNFSIQSPRHQLKIWGDYKFPIDSNLSAMSVGLGLVSQSKSQSSRGWSDEVVNSGYAVVNGRIGYQIDKTYALSLAINNLFDRKYYASVGTPNIYNFYGEPRSLMLTLKGSY